MRPSTVRPSEAAPTLTCDFSLRSLLRDERSRARACATDAVRMFKRVRIAHAVLSDPNERSRLDEEGVIAKGKGEEGRVKPFHEYYSINTPDGYAATRSQPAGPCACFVLCFARGPRRHSCVF